MKNYVQPGEVIEITAGANLVSGQPVVIGEMVGICCHDIASGAAGRVALCGVFTVVKAAGATWSKGQKLFWDKTNLNFTPTASADADLMAGFAFEDALIGATAGQLKLCCPATAKVVVSQANSVAADVAAVVVDFNALLAKLKAAGVMDN